MSVIYLGDGRKLKSYKAVVNGPKAIVRIEIEVTQPGYLGILLEDLGNITRDQKVAGRKKPLAIEDMRGRP